MNDAAAGPWGPVELMVVSLAGREPSPQVLAALRDQVQAGTVRLLDFLVVTKVSEQEVDVTEVQLEGLDDGLEAALPGLTGDEDIEDLAAVLDVGASAAIVALELVWARGLAAQLVAEGSAVLASERIPSVVVNQIATMET